MVGTLYLCQRLAGGPRLIFAWITRAFVYIYKECEFLFARGAVHLDTDEFYGQLLILLELIATADAAIIHFLQKIENKNTRVSHVNIHVNHVK